MKEIKIKVSTIVLSLSLITVSLFAGVEGFQIIELNKELENQKIKENTLKNSIEFTSVRTGKNTIENITSNVAENVVGNVIDNIVESMAKIESQGETNYTFDVMSMRENEKKDYKLNDDYTVTFEVTKYKTEPIPGFNSIYITFEFNLYVNNKYITKDSLNGDGSSIARITIKDGYLIYKTNAGEDGKTKETIKIGKDGIIISREA